jgi:translation initiation factor IF-3
VRLVGPNGEQVGIVSIQDALRLAQEQDLDLVEVAATARPPVAKVMDYGKFKYESALKAREARKNQAHTVIKEMKLRPKIDPHDYETKKGHVVRFLKAGDKVKITIMFRGREQSRPELGRRLLSRLAEDVQELGFVEFAPKQDGRNMIMVLGPHKKKTEAMAEARAVKDAAKEQRKAAMHGEGYHESDLGEHDEAEHDEAGIDETTATAEVSEAEIAAAEEHVAEPAAKKVTAETEVAKTAAAPEEQA